MLRIVLLVASLLLAGCQAPVESNPVPNETLAPTEGAIEVLLRDDRFRPVPGSRILLQEAGVDLAETEEGVYQSGGLAPGNYTLRLASSSHEATPLQVVVEAGVVTEAQVVARRVSNVEEPVLSFERTIFVTCATALGVIMVNWNCLYDSEASITARHAAPIHARGALAEAYTNQDGAYVLSIRAEEGDERSSSHFAGRDVTFTYLDKVILRDEETIASVFYEGEEATQAARGGLIGTGFGVRFALEATVLTHFVPISFEGDPRDLCSLCDSQALRG